MIMMKVGKRCLQSVIQYGFHPNTLLLLRLLLRLIPIVTDLYEIDLISRH